MHHTSADVITGGNQGGMLWQRELLWGPFVVTAARVPLGIAVTTQVQVQVLFWNITLGSDTLTVDQPALAFGYRDILAFQMSAGFPNKSGKMTMQLNKHRFMVENLS